MQDDQCLRLLSYCYLTARAGPHGAIRTVAARSAGNAAYPDVAVGPRQLRQVSDDTIFNPLKL